MISCEKASSSGDRSPIRSPQFARFACCFVVLAQLALVACGDQESDKVAADPELLARGERLFATCDACHSLEKRQNGVGPHLVNLFGRTAGSLDDFNYSEAMRNADVVWNEETLGAFLRDVQGYIPNGNMVLSDFEDEDDIKALIAYMKARDR